MELASRALSRHTDASLDVWVLDPANLTPYYCLTLCEALAGIGDRVRFITSPFRYDPGLTAPENVEIEHAYFRLLRWLQTHGGKIVRRGIQGIAYPLDHRKLLRRMKTGSPDVLHIQWSRLPVFDRPFISAVQKKGIPVIHTVHDVEPLFSGGISKLGEIYRLADALIVHTQNNAYELRERYPDIDSQRIHVIPHGPLQGDNVPAGATQELARQKLGLPLDAPVALYFGGIRPYKGLDVLIEAFPQVSQQLPDAWLVIAGRPAEKSDEPNLTPLQKANTRNQVNFDFIPNDQVWQYYLAADVVVLPYRRITQSGVLLSAMAHGRASVVTAVGGLPEVVTENTGWVVPPEDPPRLAAAIVEALSDRAKSLEKGAAAREDVNTRYSWRQIAQQTHDLYQSVIHMAKL